MRKILFLKRYNDVVGIFRKKNCCFLRREKGDKDRRHFDENSSIENAVLIRPKNIKILKMFFCRS